MASFQPFTMLPLHSIIPHYTDAHLLYWLFFECVRKTSSSLGTLHISAQICGPVGDERNVSYRKEVSQMIWCTVVARVTFCLVLHRIQFQRKDSQAFHYKNMRKFSWGASSCHHPSRLFRLILSMLGQLPSLQYCLSFLISKGFFCLCFSSLFFPLQTHLYSKMFFPSCPRRLTKC